MLGLAIVGLGGWGRRLVDAVQGKSDVAQFVAAVVRRPEAARAYAAEKSLQVFDSLEAACADPSIGGIVSCGPAHLHAAHSLQALEAGKPVLAVKPMAQSTADARRLAEAATRRGLVLALGFDRCFFPNVAELRKRIASGAFGRLIHTEGNFCVDRYRETKSGDWKGQSRYLPAGSLADHMLYLTVEVLGPIAQAQALVSRSFFDNDLPHATSVMMRAVAGQTASLTAVGVTPDYYRFQVFGEKAWAELRDDCSFTLRPRDGEIEELSLPKTDARRLEVEAFAAAVAGRAPFPVSIETAVRSVAALEAISRAADEGGAISVEQVP